MQVHRKNSTWNILSYLHCIRSTNAISLYILYTHTLWESLPLGRDPASSPSRDTGTSIVDLDDECDIGKLLECNIDLHGPSREHKHWILTSEVNPDPTSYPRTRLCASGSFRQFQPSWKQQYPWLHYSRHLNGAFCQACTFFAPAKAGGQALGQFVTKPFKSWVNKSQKMDVHAKADYHMTAMTQMNEFLVWFQSPSEAINVVFDKEAQKRMVDNQKVVEALLKVIMLCGRQGLALRGHRDDRIDWLEDQEDYDVQNRGNFIELVRFRAETDEDLYAHLQRALGMHATPPRPFKMSWSTLLARESAPIFWVKSRRPSIFLLSQTKSPMLETKSSSLSLYAMS